MTAPNFTTQPDQALAFAIPPKRVGRAFTRRVWRHVKDRWVIHLTLLALMGLFVFPFVWMLGLSLKTDDEATGTTTFPAMPRFVASSPFVRSADAVERPLAAGRARWAALEPRLEAAAMATLAPLPLPPGTYDADGDALRRAAATELVRNGIARLDESLWADDASDPAVLAQFARNLNAADASAALADRLGRIELGGIQVRGLDGHVNSVAQSWHVVSGDAQLVWGAGVQVLRYKFADSSAQPIVLRATFDARLTTDELHRVVVPYKGDASWHRVDADLTLGGQRYASERSTYVAQHRGASFLFQPPTFQDDTLGARTWTSLKPAGTVNAASPTDASLTLTLRPSSTGRAVWGKVERNYVRAFRSGPFWTYVGNSIVIVALQVAGALFSSAFVGYAFARLRWPGRSLAMGLLLATMMLPGQVTMIPSFLIWKQLGWYNTLNPLWAGAWLGNAFFIFLMVQNMRTIPRELDEAARIDGMNALQTWWYVIVPQVKPTLAAIAILTFMGAWNDFLGPLIMLRDQTLFPLSLGLYAMRADAISDWPLIMAGNLLMTLPVIVIFFVFQRYFIEGVTVTGMKG